MGPLVESVVEDKLLVADGILIAVLAGERRPPGSAEEAAGGDEDVGRSAEEEDGTARRRFLRRLAKGAPLVATAKAKDFCVGKQWLDTSLLSSDSHI
jgi:hypothetical protein